MKKLCILFLVLACAFSTFLACNNTSETSESGQNESSQVLDSEQSNIPDSSITEEITFTISFLPENGTDERLDYEYKAGEQVTIPENSFIYEGYIFIGWENENVVYQAGETFTMPEHNVEMMAKWEAIPEEPSPSFSQSEYEYDKLGGFDLELPLDLDGANLYYVEIDGEIIAPADYSYNEDTKCLVISANIVLALSFETHEIVAITDAETEQPVKCLVTVTQSLKTTFDEETTKDFIYGKDLGVTFEV